MLLYMCAKRPRLSERRPDPTGPNVRPQWADGLLPPYNYNRERPHRSLGLRSPIATMPQQSGAVVSRSVLSGLHHAYARAA